MLMNCTTTNTWPLSTRNIFHKSQRFSAVLALLPQEKGFLGAGILVFFSFFINYIFRVTKPWNAHMRTKLKSSKFVQFVVYYEDIWFTNKLPEIVLALKREPVLNLFFVSVHVPPQ